MVFANIILTNASFASTTCQTAIETQQTSSRSVTKVNLNDNDNKAWYWFIAKSEKVLIQSSHFVYLYEDCQQEKQHDSYYHNYADTLPINFKYLNLNIGQKYYIKINANHRLLFSVVDLIIPDNNNCANALSVVQNNSIVTTKQVLQNSGSMALWYRFKATSSHVKIFSNSFQLDLYTACNGSLIAPNASSYSSLSVDSLPKLNKYTNLIAGQEYFVNINGNSEVKIAIVGFTPPSHDECSGAKPIEQTATRVLYIDTLSNATASAATHNGADLWYTFLAKTNSVQIEANSVSLYEACGGKLVEAVYKNNAAIYTDLVIGKSYTFVLASYNSGDLKFAVFNKDVLPNDNCSGAYTIAPADTFISHDADASMALPSHSPIDGYEAARYSDLWYKFIANSTSMSVQAYPSGETYPQHSVWLALYDGCDGTLLGTSKASSGILITHAEIQLHNLTVGQEYIYRIVDLGNWFMPVRTEQVILKPGLIVHGVVSLPTDVNDSIAKATLICYDEIIYHNSVQYKKGRQVINGSNCSTGISDNRTIEGFFKFCDLFALGDGISVKSSNQNLLIKLEILADQGNNSYQQIYCTNMPRVHDSKYYLSNHYLNHNYQNLQNKILRIEMSDTSKTGPVDFDFAVVFDQTVDNVDDHMFSAKAKIYPNPALDQITIELENDNAAKVEMFNQYGKLVLTRDLTEKTVTFEHELPAGLYIVKLRGANKNSSTKLLIK